jgi:hypothetical protein
VRGATRLETGPVLLGRVSHGPYFDSFPRLNTHLTGLSLDGTYVTVLINK